MVMADDHRSPRADVVDVMVAVDVHQVRALRALDEERFAADRFERAHRRIDAARHQRLGAGEQGVGTAGVHAVAGLVKGGGDQSNRTRHARAAATGSGASNTPLTTAIRSAPAATTIAAFSGVIPPIATRGSPNAAACRRSSGVARRAMGLVGEAKNAPNAR